VTGRPYHRQRRGIGFVFQHYAAFKHLTVRDNVAFGLKIRKKPKAEIKEEGRQPSGSGGARGVSDPLSQSALRRPSAKRMALARALAVDPEVLLLDEAVRARLDAKVREGTCGPGCGDSTTRCT